MSSSSSSKRAQKVFSGTFSTHHSQSEPQKLRREGSFYEHIIATQAGEEVGYLKLEHSGTTRVTTITTMQNSKPDEISGTGTALFKRAEQTARAAKATQLQTSLTAKDARGFYTKMGMAPDPNLVQRFKKTYEDAGMKFSDAQIQEKVPTWVKNLAGPTSHLSSSSDIEMMPLRTRAQGSTTASPGGAVSSTHFPLSGSRTLPSTSTPSGGTFSSSSASTPPINSTTPSTGASRRSLSPQPASKPTSGTPK
ncbi:GNAT family N-acetyltransferase [Massilia sp. CCM 9210]|uniref:GNAT family N-acetyltransferase n=1 Tax=Massilia scottii TaxID=3057166 RepID=UPI0027969809|nr:GNAT family N-acetyltransferase [Massilia sp. CCM 9210]MDQ1812080.1 GNAT family N-acetyltransferase [Massilia sp. CCM 9210]